MIEERIAASFRDPSGFLFVQDGSLFRQVNRVYQDDYQALKSSGLYDVLVQSGVLLSHEEIEISKHSQVECFAILKPELIPFISYPYEWCFSQLKDAALTTLNVLKTAIEHGMILKDGSAYNVQFLGATPIFIDTLSFERYQDGQIWYGYKQFCQHFLAPLALMSACDLRMGLMLRKYIDGVPLDLASKLLPQSTWLDFGLLSHLHLHAKSQSVLSGKSVKGDKLRLKRNQLLALVENLRSCVQHLALANEKTTWSDYNPSTESYSEHGFNHKKEIVEKLLNIGVQRGGNGIIWDLGANTGKFSRLAARTAKLVVSIDGDPLAVDRNYNYCKEGKENNILPLLADLDNPSPAIGWKNQERMSLAERGPAGLVMALAIVHHLAISNNVPLEMIGDLFASLCDKLVIEFIPKSDEQVKSMLANRRDVFPDYTEAGFEKAMEKFFTIEEKIAVDDSHRTLYLMLRRAVA